MKIQQAVISVGVAVFATAALAQPFSIDWHSIDSGGGTSTGGVYSMIGSIAQPDAGEMSGGDYTMDGGFSSILETIPAITTIFDNAGGSFNGQQAASMTSWLAGKFCLGSQSYTLDSVTLFLSSGDTTGQPHDSAVRLQIYSNDLVSGKPAGSTGPMMNLSGRTNPITLAAGNVPTPVTWTPATPFGLAANKCYWAVLSVDSGANAWQSITVEMPTGVAGTFGRSYSGDAGATWVQPDNSSNYKMLIRGTAVTTPQELVITAVSTFGNDLRISFPALSGRSYVIESRADVAAGEWAIVPETTRVGSGALIELTLVNALTQPQQFYRVKQLP